MHLGALVVFALEHWFLNDALALGALDGGPSLVGEAFDLASTVDSLDEWGALLGVGIIQGGAGVLGVFVEGFQVADKGFGFGGGGVVGEDVGPYAAGLDGVFVLGGGHEADD